MTHDRPARRLATLVVRHRRVVVALWVCFAAFCAALVPRFRIDPDLTALLPRDLPEVRAMVGASAVDRASRELVVVVRDAAVGADPERVRALAEQLAGSDDVERVTWARADWLAGTDASARAPLWFLPSADLDALEARLVAPGRRAAAEESRRLLADDPFLGREVVRRDPLGLRWAFDPERAGPLASKLEAGREELVLSSSGATLLRITGRDEPFDQDATKRLITHLRSKLEGLESDLVGGYAIASEDAARIRGDMIFSSLTAAPVVLIFLVASLGSFVFAHVVLSPVLVAILAALGLGGALLGPMPAVAVGSAAILVGLGVDFGLHVATRWIVESAREQGEGPAADVAAAERTLEGTGVAVVCGAATSVVTFLAFAATSIEGLARFGVLLAIGLVVALGASLTLVPALAPRGVRVPSRPGLVVRSLLRLAESPLRRHAATLVIVMSVALGAIALRRGVRFDADPGFLRPADSEVVRATERLALELGFAPAALVVLTPVDAVRADPTALYEAGSQLMADGVAGLVTGGALGIPEADRALRVRAFRERTGGWVEGALGDLEAAGLRSASLREPLEEQARLFALDPGTSPGVAGDRVDWEGAAWLRSAVHPGDVPRGPEQRDALRAAVREAFPDGSRIVDPYGLADALGPALARGLERSVLACGLAVALLVWLAVRRGRDVLVALAPTACALSATVGVLALAGWPLHPGNLVALPLVLGLGVDDGLHLVLRRREGGPAREASWSDTFSTAGVGVWRTTVTTALGFGSLAFARTPALASLGLVVLVGISVAFLATVVIVPVMMGPRDRA